MVNHYVSIYKKMPQGSYVNMSNQKKKSKKDDKGVFECWQLWRTVIDDDTQNLTIRMYNM